MAMIWKYLVSKIPYRLRRLRKDVDLVAGSGLFDEKWYIARGGSKTAPLLEYCLGGFDKGRSCNYLFDENWYLLTNPDVRKTKFHPLVHYLRFGEKEGRSPSPLFDIAGYRLQLGGEEPPSLLKHYLDGGWNKGLRPVKYFEPAYYLPENPDVGMAGLDPYFHYLFTGFKEGRRPSRRFSFDAYSSRYGLTPQSPVSPLAHFLYNNNGNDALVGVQGPAAAPASAGQTLVDALKEYRSPGRGHEERIFDLIPGRQPKAQVIAFYLPQFHPIPENNKWWGEGFTEWTNTTRTMPRFAGHYQPHLAGALGYYDLRNESVIAAQVELAKKAGISGFCFYYYNFNGKRLLEKPSNAFLDHQEWEMDFCLMWANENWTRRWDGLEDDVLMRQDYLEEDDADLVADIARHFKDPRYIRIDGRPLLFIYRPGIISNTKDAIARWRDMFLEQHGERPLIFMAQVFGDNDPRVFGLDGAIEFPPHKLAAGLPQLNKSLQVFDPDFSGVYFSYDDLIEASLSVNQPEFPLIRTAVPAWDNEARKPGKGMGFVGSDPTKYEHWLGRLIEFAIKNPIGEAKPLVFVNAWNEWAEGAHLEPDIYWGHAYLNATKRVVMGHTDPKDMTIIYVGHDAHRHGAQLLSLNIVKTLVRTFGMRVEVILLEGGALEPAFCEIAPTHVVGDSMEAFRQVAQDIKRRVGAQYAICNTVVTGNCCKELSKLGIRTISLIHELKTLIEERHLEDRAAAVSEYASKVVFAAPFVRDSFETIVGDLGDKVVVRPQGIYQDLVVDTAEVMAFRDKHHIPKTAKVVVNVGFGDLRKGFDLFVRIAQVLIKQRHDYYFLWLGDIEGSLAHWIGKEVEALGKRFIHVPFSSEVAKGLANASVFCLTSREDPFPSVVMEALALGVPVVGFDDAGGFADLLEEPANGALVPFGDVDAMVSALRELAEGDTQAAREARASQAVSRFDWDDYVFSLAELLCPTLKRVSVVVPNYNCMPYIQQRLVSIFRQRYPVYEVIVLDDASTDASLANIKEIASEMRRKIKLVCNDKNSGGAFPQWIRGAEAAKGEYLWIAEADDAAESTFLSTLLARMDEGIALAYCDSKQIDEAGKHLADDYQYYYRTVDGELFSTDFRMPGKNFMARCLSVKNLILNVSSVLTRRNEFLRTVEKCRDKMLMLRVAGDWYFYANLLSDTNGDVIFVRSPLNIHRRHQGSITSSLAKQRHLDEVVMVQRLVDQVVSLGSEERAMVARYRQELEQQFGLANTDSAAKVHVSHSRGAS
jgi:glycosyltransferase involved in cell wall biosynthesis